MPTATCALSRLLWFGICCLTTVVAGCSKKPQAGTGTSERVPSPNASSAIAGTQPTGPAESRKLKLALNWVPEPEFGGFYAAREGGKYRAHGLDVEILGGGAGVPVLQMVATGRADFGTVGADDVITGQARGTDVVALFATFQTNPQGIMVHASRKLTRLEDVFHSGTLALETGMAYTSYLKHRFSWSGVKVVPYDGGVARFLADPQLGQQCYVTSEPLVAKHQGGDPQVFLIADSGWNPYATVVVTRRELLTREPELVKQFVTATREGWQSYLDNPAPIHGVLTRLNSTLDEASLAEVAEVQKPLIETAETRSHGLGSMQAARWETLASQMLELKLIEKKPAVDRLFAQ